MTVVGLTGGTGSGKTTALEALASLGAAVIDCDRVYHDLLISSAGMLSRIGSRFPGAVRGGALDRRALAARVFTDEAALSDLNAITHPFVIAETRRLLDLAAGEGRTLAAIDAIALFESGMDRLCDVTVFVTADPRVRAERITARDGITYGEALRRIAAQRPDDWFAARCGYTLVNNYPEKEDFFIFCREFFDNMFSGGKSNV